MTLRISAGETQAYLDPLGQFSLQIAIERADKNPDVEKNQLILESIMCGRLDLYVQVQDNYEDNIRTYWGGWRRESQVAEEFLWVIKK